MLLVKTRNYRGSGVGYRVTGYLRTYLLSESRSGKAVNYNEQERYNTFVERGEAERTERMSV